MMPRSWSGTPARLVALLVAAAVAALLVVAGAAPRADAEPPSRLQTQVTDSVGALGGERGAVESRLADLRSRENVQLWVVFVDSFDGIGREQWAMQTWRQSDLGTTDALLAVAVEDRTYQFLLDDPGASASSDQQRADRIGSSDIEPRLAADDWAGAVTGAADGLEGRGSGSGAGVSGWVVLALLAGVVAVVAAVITLSRRRTARRTAEQAEAARDIPGDDPRLARLPIEVLDQRARAGLVDADQAVEASRTALETASSEFGELRTRPFREALGAATAELAAAHTVVQRLDDDIPETPAQRHAMLLEVAARSERAESGLAGQAEAFARMRDLLINGGATVDALTRRAVTLRARLPESARTLEELRERFPAGALASIGDNVDLATELVTAAESEVERARGALARPVGEQGEAVDAITTAEGELARAEKLLDGVDHAADDIATARRDLGALIAEVDEELEIAARLLGSTDVSDATTRRLRDSATAARTAADDARRDGETDPLGTFSRLVDVDRDLDEALAAAGNEAETATRARAARQAALTRARGAVREADDYISARSYVIGQTARTRLSSAKEALATAEATAGPAAFPYADRAIALARDALRQAQNDASRPQYTGRYHGGPRGGSSTGAMVGGMVAGALIQGMMRGAGSSFGSGRSWGGGGFGGGGFGGGGFGGGGFGGGSAGGRF